MKQLVLISGILTLVLVACGKEEATTVTPMKQEAAPATPAPAASAPMTAPATRAAVPAPAATPAPAAPAPAAKEATPAAPAAAGAGDAMEAGKALAKQSGCFACHNVEQKRIGPAWNEVSKKYKGDTGAHDNLVKWVHTGGTGRWQMGTMPAYSPRVPDADIEKLVDFILSLSK